MKKVMLPLFGLFILSGCAESLALLGPASTSATGGNLAQTTFSSAFSYGVKKQTGKSPSQHFIEYIEKNNPEKKKEPCLSFVEKTNSEICVIVKKQMDLTKSKIKTITRNKTLKDLTSSIQPNIDKKYKIKYLD